MNEKDFKELIRVKRTEFMNSFAIVHSTFGKLGLDKKAESYFFHNASDVVEILLLNNWESFLSSERKFTVELMKGLFTPAANTMSQREAVENYIDSNVDNFYSLESANSQNRANRSEREFAAIIMHLFIGAGIPVEARQTTTDYHADGTDSLNLVEYVVPGNMEFELDSKNTMVVAARASLTDSAAELEAAKRKIQAELQSREISKLYLATLDEKIPASTLQALKANNIYLVCSENIKAKKYKDYEFSLSFEEMLELAKVYSDKWSKADYPAASLQVKQQQLQAAIASVSDQPDLSKYLQKQLDFFA